MLCTHSCSLLCLNESVYRILRFRLISLVSFSCRLFDNSAGKRSAISVNEIEKRNEIHKKMMRK